MNDEQLFRNCFNIIDPNNENQTDENDISKLEQLSIHESKAAVDFPAINSDLLFEANDYRGEQRSTMDMSVSQIKDATPQQTVIYETGKQEDANESGRTDDHMLLDSIDLDIEYDVSGFIYKIFSLKFKLKLKFSLQSQPSDGYDEHNVDEISDETNGMGEIESRTVTMTIDELHLHWSDVSEDEADVSPVSPNQPLTEESHTSTQVC